MTKDELATIFARHEAKCRQLAVKLLQFDVPSEITPFIEAVAQKKVPISLTDFLLKPYKWAEEFCDYVRKHPEQFESIVSALQDK